MHRPFIGIVQNICSIVKKEGVRFDGRRVVRTSLPKTKNGGLDADGHL
jgi:hypothetical protein